jgi:hypothetical protein
MKLLTIVLAGTATAALLASAHVITSQATAAAPPPAPMTFFVTSVGKGDGANLGGLAGADAHCQALAAAAGRGSATWRAYLSTQGPSAVNARDRIGAGPWHNARGQLVGQSVAAIHGDTIEQARGGVIFGKQFSLTEKGEIVPGAGDTPNEHDILTGSTPEGRAYPAGEDRTCSNWTSNAAGTAQLGHHDKQGGGGGSWNSQHVSRGCSQPNLVSTGGAGRFYCFAAS